MSVFLLTLFLCLCCVQSQLNLPEGSSCSANGKTGKCVQYKRCLSLIQDRKDGRRPEICSYAGRKPIVCCTDCDLVDDIDKIVIDPQVGLRYKDGSKAWDYCLENYQNLPYDCKNHYSYELKRDWNETRQCHFIRYTAVGAVGGVDAGRAEFPHMALLGYGAEPDAMQWLCGGSLISDRYILTAAHCSASALYGAVTTAALGILKRSDPAHLWHKYQVLDIIRHPQYHPPSKYNDIALLKTDTRVKFSPVVLPACLDTRDTFRTKEGWGYAMGWGALGDKRPLADTLQKVIVQRFTNEECGLLYTANRLLSSGYDQETQVCYGSRADIQDTCGGDSGGPVVILNGCMYDITGVTSYGRACGVVAGQAGMYTRVRHYVPWIESIVWPGRKTGR